VIAEQLKPSGCLHDIGGRGAKSTLKKLFDLPHARPRDCELTLE
jgi:hypothetical protein